MLLTMIVGFHYIIIQWTHVIENEKEITGTETDEEDDEEEEET